MDTVTQADLLALRAEIRDTRLMARALMRRVPSARWEVLSVRREEEHSIRPMISAQALMAIEVGLGFKPGDTFPTLEDLTFHARDEVAGWKGVGPKAMERLDAAMAEAGLSWAESDAAAAYEEVIEYLSDPADEPSRR